MDQINSLPGQLAPSQEPPIQLTLKNVLRNLPGTVWILLDYILSVLAVLLTMLLLPECGRFLGALAQQGLHPNWFIISYALSIITLAHIFGLHEPRMKRERARLAVNLFVVVAGTSILLTTTYSAFFAVSAGYQVLLAAAILTWTGIFLSRLLFWKLTGEAGYDVCLIGSPEFLEEAEPLFRKEMPNLNLHPHTPPPSNASEDEENLQDWILKQSFDEVVLQPSVSQEIMAPATSCMDRGVPVFSYSRFIENHLRRVSVSHLDEEWFLRASLLGLQPHYRISKRLLDVGISICGLLLSAPIIIFAAFLIRATSRGPVFYSQTRVGLYNRPFRIYKLRTMTVDAEQSGAQWAQEKDNRVTLVGKVLRKTRIDELPQFWNILRGDMGFIGPRPERPEFTSKLAREIPFYEKRHLVKPGLTGWAQINYPYGASIEDARNKLEYDLFYVKRGSLQLDLHILVRTIGAIMKGAR